MYFDVEKSLKKGRVVYQINFWDSFFTLLIPRFFIFVLLLPVYSYFKEAIEEENTEVLLYTSAYTLVVLIPVILYFLQSHLSSVEGRSRSNNVKLTREFAEQEGYKIHEETNEMCLIYVEPWFFHNTHKRWLIVLYDGDQIYYNCATFEDVWMPRYHIEDFRNPLLWFNNKRHERRFRKFIQNQNRNKSS